MSSPSQARGPRILVIAAYFGRLPDHFDLWMRSCARNQGIDWLVVTDDPRLPAEVPGNVRLQPMSFEHFHRRLRERVGVAPDRLIPYKIVDFKPAFGHLFAEEVGPYDFWGCCDLDMIFGDVMRFIPPEVFDTFSKIFNRGHLTLYRNSQEANGFYRLKAPGIDWETILRDPAPRLYDEWRGVHAVLKHHQIPQYHDEVIVDVDPARFRFTTTKHRNHRLQAFFWEDGRVHRVHWEDPRWERTEFAYIHFQKRRVARGRFPSSVAAYYITPYGFIEKQDAEPSSALIRQLNGPSVLEEARYAVGRIARKFRSLVVATDRGVKR